jgi:hypothetical protein
MNLSSIFLLHFLFQVEKTQTEKKNAEKKKKRRNAVEEKGIEDEMFRSLYELFEYNVYSFCLANNV